MGAQERIRLECVTLTGADESVDPRELLGIYKKYPLVEWGILLDSELTGPQRYPGADWIDAFLDQYHGRKSLHLCGGRIADFVAGEKETLSLAQRFNRIQLNLGAIRDLPPADDLDEAIRGFSHPVILQYAPGSVRLIQHLNARNIQILFDASAGRGQTPQTWPTPLAGRKCGYAGGLGPGNISYEFARIAKAAGQQRFWIDMESSLRDASSIFDTKRASTILKTVSGSSLDSRAFRR